MATVLIDGRRVANKVGLGERKRNPAARVLLGDGFYDPAAASVRKLSVSSNEATKPLAARGLNVQFYL